MLGTLLRLIAGVYLDSDDDESDNTLHCCHPLVPDLKRIKILQFFFYQENQEHGAVIKVALQRFKELRQ